MPVPPRWPARCGLVRRSSEEQEKAAGEEKKEKEQAEKEEEQPGSALSGARTDQAPLPAGEPRLPSPGSNGRRRVGCGDGEWWWGGEDREGRDTDS